MKKCTLFIFLFLTFSVVSKAFCGFYVAKAGSDLYNQKSEVILVRDGNQTTITMSNDFTGNVKDFAMVIPVPNVLKREDIKIADRSVFSKLDAYSAPRLVEYYDANPCNTYSKELYLVEEEADEVLDVAPTIVRREDKKYKVKIDAVYNVAEYEIIILSAKDSEGLKNWLVDNGYKIPLKAEKVLKPYIKSNLKFFVVKVDLNKYNPQSKGGFLRPLQIKVQSKKFMLPIRLGMANAIGEQDMIVYAFSKKGRIEFTNYRTVDMPTNRNVPTFVKPNFGNFYKDLFRNNYQREGRDAVMLEYAWNVTPRWSGVKCDPCVGNPPYFKELIQAGVHWTGSNIPVHFTRLHVRYILDKFPEDLFFQETPNNQRFQARYVITHPATGNLNCEDGMKYKRKLRQRRRKELSELAALTQWNTIDFYDYVANGTDKIKTVSDTDENEALPFSSNGPAKNKGFTVLFFSLFSLLLLYSGRSVLYSLSLLRQ